MKKALFAGLAAVALAMAPQAASAAPFTGTLGYAGVWTLPAGTGGFDDETQVGIVSALVLDATGTFAAEGIVPGTVLVHASPIVYVPPTPPAGPMWWDPVSGISFYLTSMSVESVDGLEVVLRGRGYFSGAGYDDTEGDWAFTAQRSSGQITRASYSADTAVPEPATLVLLGIGLIGAGVVRRRVRR